MKTALAWFIAMLVAAFFIVWGLFFANPVADASNGSARIEVFWTGTPCIEVVHATGRYETICGGYDWFYSYDVYAGVQVGVDPIMGDATTISCVFYLNGQIEYSDLAVRGDGTDVNCILDIYSKNGRLV